ncbi:MAG: TonB-dependent receptor [Saprospiraceae bacterium]|nr:MAG: TonB-dependent receptor [Saprospiraceae bacterium]
MAQSPDSSSLWAIDLEDVVVTAQYAPTDSRSAVHDIRTIKASEMVKRGVTNLEQLLKQDVNIRINQDMILGSSMSLLGIDGQNVKIMIDGVPVIGRQDGNIDLSQINLQNIERVEIVEGPLAVSYGTDALAGVINLISKKSQLSKYEFGVQNQFEERGENSYTAQAGTRFGKRLLLRMNGGYEHFDGYSEDTLRSVLWNPKEQWFGEASLRYQLGESHHLRYAFGYFDEEVVNLGEMRRPQFKPYAFDDQYETRRLNHSLTQEGEMGEKYYLQSTLAYNHYRRYKHSFRTDFETNSREVVLGQQDTSLFQGVTFRTTIASRFKHSPLNFQLGLDLRYDHATGQRIQDSLSKTDHTSRIGDYALFASLRYIPVKKLTLEGGLRYAWNTRYDAPFIPSIHLKYDFDQQYTIRASYSRGFRSPDLKELFFNFIDINHFIVGNPDLQAEKSDNLQASLSFRKKKFEASLKGFYNHITDKIELFEFMNTPTGIIPAVDTSTLQYSYFNQAIYKTKGITLRLGYQTKNLKLQAGFSLMGYFNPESEAFTNVNDFSYALEWNNEISYLIPSYALSFSLFSRKTDRRFTYFPEVNDAGDLIVKQRIQGGYSLIDFTINKSFWKQRLHFTAGIKNLLNVQQVEIKGSLSGSAHNSNMGTSPISAGRNLFLGVGYIFEANHKNKKKKAPSTK